MPIELEKQYLKDKERAIRSIGEAIIEKTEKLFESNPSHPSLHNKPIICSKDKIQKRSTFKTEPQKWLCSEGSTIYSYQNTPFC
jgi:hypothetical protein